jgi:hypothetical protein
MRYLFIILLFTSCATKPNIQFEVAKVLNKSGYYIFSVNHCVSSIIKNSQIEVSAEYYMQTGKYKTLDGFYSPVDKKIYYHKGCDNYIIAHEYFHYYLYNIGIPIPEHHKIIWSLEGKCSTF